MDNPGMERHGLIGWNELITNDLASAKSFYSELLDWQLTSVESENGEYAVVNVGDRKFAGMMKTPPMAGNTPPTWSCYVTVDDVDARCKRAESLGGKVIVPPTDIPNGGRFSFITDPQGATIGLITYTNN